MQYTIFLHPLEYFLKLTSSGPRSTKFAVAFREERPVLVNGGEREDERGVNTPEWLEKLMIEVSRTQRTRRRGLYLTVLTTSTSQPSS